MLSLFLCFFVVAEGTLSNRVKPLLTTETSIKDFIRKSVTEGRQSRVLPRPHIVFILADDLGWNDIGFRNTKVRTPWINALAGLGVRLESHYSYRRCAPARAALFTGRDGFRHGATRMNLPPQVPEGVDLSYKMLPMALKAGGYRTHMLGKWHQGFFSPPYRPSNRGFDTFHGYFSGQEDHYTQRIEASCDFGHAVDLHTQTGLAIADVGSYNSARWMQMAEQIIKDHNKSQPLFLFLSLQNTHAPLQAPSEVSKKFYFSTDDGGESRRTYYGMISMIDLAVANITSALVKEEMWQNTLFIWTSDNGARVTLAGSNHPLRGGKNSNWEGGIRTPAVFTGGMLPEAMHGRELQGLFSITDWYSTIAHAAKVELDQGGVVPIESINQWPYLMGWQSESARETVVHDHMYVRPGSGESITNATGALRHKNWKLVVGPDRLSGWYGEWGPVHSNIPEDAESESGSMAAGELCAAKPCLFNIATDPEEREDLADSHPTELSIMMQKWEALMDEYHPPLDGPAPDAEGACRAWEYSGGFVVPWIREDALATATSTSSSTAPPSSTAAAEWPAMGVLDGIDDVAVEAVESVQQDVTSFGRRRRHLAVNVSSASLGGNGSGTLNTTSDASRLNMSSILNISSDLNISSTLGAASNPAGTTNSSLSDVSSNETLGESRTNSSLNSTGSLNVSFDSAGDLAQRLNITFVLEKASNLSKSAASYMVSNGSSGLTMGDSRSNSSCASTASGKPHGSTAHVSSSTTRSSRRRSSKSRSSRRRS